MTAAPFSGGTLMKDRIDRIRFVTRHFNELQGLRGMMTGLMVMSMGISQFFRSLPVAILNVLVCLGSLIVLLRIKPYYRRAFGEVEQPPVLVEEGLPSIYSSAGPAPLVIDRRPVRRTVWTFVAVCALFLVLRAALPTASLVPDGSGIDPWVQLHPPTLLIEAGGPHLPGSMSDLMLILSQWLYVLCGTVFLVIWFHRERRLSQSYYLFFGAPLLGLGLLSASLGGVVSAFGMPRIVNFCLPALASFCMPLILCGGTLFLCGLLDHLQIVRALRPASGGATA
jgi:hypothetical protein